MKHRHFELTSEQLATVQPKLPALQPGIEQYDFSRNWLAFWATNEYAQAVDADPIATLADYLVDARARRAPRPQGARRLSRPMLRAQAMADQSEAEYIVGWAVNSVEDKLGGISIAAMVETNAQNRKQDAEFEMQLAELNASLGRLHIGQHRLEDDVQPRITLLGAPAAATTLRPPQTTDIQEYFTQ